MLSGRRLDLLDPDPRDIAIEDIAHGLARVARWNGQTAGPHIFSVAQHSLLVEVIVSAGHAAGREVQLSALLHDAPEYVIGDLISPFKAVLGDDYKAVEHRLLAAIHARFALPPPSTTWATRVKTADTAAARLEAEHLAGFAVREADLFFGAPHPRAASFLCHLEPEPAEAVQGRFLARFDALQHSA